MSHEKKEAEVEEVEEEKGEAERGAREIEKRNWLYYILTASRELTQPGRMHKSDYLGG